ncbi:MAG: ABC transporter substrate-binding protein [Desulfosalsimonas sp.]|uniref:ABC transporter substrate-binding protein n=1 Tax=Desulfosalsimonas sp. TaxID=3073848 RepID=UPI0039709F71
MKTNKISIWLIVSAVALMLAVPGSSMAGEVYKTALSLAITGPTSDAGNPYSKGTEDYFKYVNDMGLLGDDEIECKIRDDKYETAITKRNFEEFLDWGIDFYLNYSTGSTLALKRDFDEVEMPTLPASYHAGNIKGSDYIFLPIASYSAQNIGLAEYVVDHHEGGTPKVAMYVHPSAFGREPVKDVEKAIEAGLDIELVEMVEHGEGLDVSGTLQRWRSKGVQYVISQTVQSPVATLLKGASRMGLVAESFGQKGKMTFMGAHYTGGNDLVALAGDAAENYYWTTSFISTSEPSAGAEAQLALAEKYGRDEKAANSHNYAAGILVAEITTEVIKRAKAKGKEINKENLYEELLGMNGMNAFYSQTAVGPVTYSEDDHQGVDTLQLYVVRDGEFRAEGKPFIPEYTGKIE